MTHPDHRAEIVTDQSTQPKKSETRAELQPNPWRLEIGDWSALQARAAPIRLEVFVHEQQVPLEEEIDALDAECIHAVAFDAQGCALATGRLLPDGHIGRMAVLKTVRGQGLGSAVLQALMQQARQKGFVEAALSAQTHAQAFYARHGFVPEGAEYLDANIPHVLMRKAL
ncbi:MAG: GNAT family N-acetyltransferase [Candidatus Methylopumilus sp.]|nr:GNAT family N-acetyltransferase [Candidatus Methylopumilus sp.]